VGKRQRIRLFHLDRFGRKLEESVDDEVMRALAGGFDDSLSDVSFAFQSLRKTWDYTAVTVLSRAVGIGVNSAFSSAIHAVWVAPVPGVTGQDRIVDPVIVPEGADWWGWTFPDYAAVREAETPSDALGAWIEEDATLGADDGAERIRGIAASAQAGAALSLLVLGALFLRSLGRTDGSTLGFRLDGMIVTDFRAGGLSSALIDLLSEGYPSREEGGEALIDQLQERIRAIPGVTAVALADGALLAAATAMRSMLLRMSPLDPFSFLGPQGSSRWRCFSPA
jgi:hypothetical protein